MSWTIYQTHPIYRYRRTCSVTSTKPKICCSRTYPKIPVDFILSFNNFWLLRPTTPPPPEFPVILCGVGYFLAPRNMWYLHVHVRPSTGWWQMELRFFKSVTIKSEACQDMHVQEWPINSVC